MGPAYAIVECMVCKEVGGAHVMDWQVVGEVSDGLVDDGMVA